MAQRQEMFAEMEPHYMEWEQEALRLIPHHDEQQMPMTAIRSIWIAWAGEPPANWRERVSTMVDDAVAVLTEGVAVERGKLPWVDETMLRRTIYVIQRRSLFAITPRKATRMLCSIAALAQQGVAQ